jgi:hypothetical protein
MHLRAKGCRVGENDGLLSKADGIRAEYVQINTMDTATRSERAGKFAMHSKRCIIEPRWLFGCLDSKLHFHGFVQQLLVEI